MVDVEVAVELILFLFFRITNKDYLLLRWYIHAISNFAAMTIFNLVDI
jgi:hypothetical protein